MIGEEMDGAYPMVRASCQASCSDDGPGVFTATDESGRKRARDPSQGTEACHRLAIIADDLTGALDTAVQCVHSELPTLVILGAAPLQAGECHGYSVLVIDTDSRHVGPEEAARRVQSALSLARLQGADTYYKKIDSTLRGNIGAELEAMLDGTRLRELVLAPALPALGRTVRGGAVYVHGVPLASTDFARDPVHPMTRSHIPQIMAAQSTITVSLLAGPEQIPPEIDAHERDIVYLFDAETDGQLNELAQEVVRRRRFRLCAGSAGFMRALSGALPLQTPGRRPPTQPVQAATRHTSPVLFVCGSLHPASRRAVARAVAAGYPRLVLPISELLDAANHEPIDVDRLQRETLRSLEAHGRLILETEPTPWADARSDVTMCRAIASRVGQFAASIVAASSLATVVAFGGDTSAAIVHALDVDRLIPEGEILPGVAVSRIAAQGRTLSLVTKPGGYVHDHVVDAIEAWRMAPIEQFEKQP